MVTIDPRDIDRFEDETQLWGKRARDIPQLGEWRARFVSRFHRLGEFNLAVALFQVPLAFSPTNPLQWLAALSVPVAAAAMVFAEWRAAIMVRQLNRRAAEQFLRDIMGIRE